MKKILLFLVVAAFGAASAFAQKAPQSRIETDSIYSEVLKAKRAYTVYLPPSWKMFPTSMPREMVRLRLPQTGQMPPAEALAKSR